RSVLGGGAAEVPLLRGREDPVPRLELGPVAVHDPPGEIREGLGGAAGAAPPNRLQPVLLPGGSGLRRPVLLRVLHGARNGRVNGGPRLRCGPFVPRPAPRGLVPLPDRTSPRPARASGLQ